MEHAEFEVARLRRALAQQLMSLSRAGIRDLPRTEEAIDLSPFQSTETVAKTETTAPPKSTPPTPPQRSHAPSPPKVELAPSLFTSGPKERCTLSRSEREHELEQLAGQVAACTRCQELADTRTQTVFGVGNPEANILFLGEAPGADEDRLGEPFVGKAGQLLDRIIKACTLKREEIYICNILRCRPPGNRNPTDQEAANCREYLDGQIAIVDPDYIVCWGSVAARNLLGTTSSIGRMRGRFFNHGRAKVLCTYHPSYLLRNESAKKDVWEDMKFLMRDMGIELGKK
ncbi:MAG: uracil-DNA glycosylase [Planctomycetaceae bacterium]|nr:uracil-DNA glycosylase [Planctomycetaceae bacterium]